MSETPRFGFVTCVQLGLDVMEEIAELGGELDLVITLPDGTAQAKSGRVYLDDFCDRHGFPLLKSRSVNDDEVVSAIKGAGIDWLFIIGWSQIASGAVLGAPTRGCIGMHPTLLPEGRGRASIPWAIIKDLSETGVTMFQLDEGVDTGPILAQHRIPLSQDTDATGLYQSVQSAHRQLIRDSWAPLTEGTVNPSPQDPSSGSFWPGRTPADGELQPEMTVIEALRLIRATTRPYPGAFWRGQEGVVRVWRAQECATPSRDNPHFRCSDGFLEATDYEFEAGRDT